MTNRIYLIICLLFLTNYNSQKLQQNWENGAIYTVSIHEEKATVRYKDSFDYFSDHILTVKPFISADGSQVLEIRSKKYFSSQPCDCRIKISPEDTKVDIYKNIVLVLKFNKSQETFKIQNETQATEQYKKNLKEIAQDKSVPKIIRDYFSNRLSNNIYNEAIYGVLNNFVYQLIRFNGIEIKPGNYSFKIPKKKNPIGYHFIDYPVNSDIVISQDNMLRIKNTSNLNLTEFENQRKNDEFLQNAVDQVKTVKYIEEYSYNNKTFIPEKINLKTNEKLVIHGNEHESTRTLDIEITKTP